MTDYEKLKIRELHLIASALVEFVNCKCVQNDDYANLDAMLDDYNALDDYVLEMCKLDGEEDE